MPHADGSTAEQLDCRLARGAALAAVALLAAMAAPWLAGRLYVFDDLGAYHLPLRVFYAACLERGEPFDWMPQLYCGWFVTGEGQLGGYHPAHWLAYRALPWPTAFGIELLASYVLLTLGLFVLLRRWLGGAASAYGALVGGFSGFALLHFAHVNAVAVLAHVPWLLAAQDALWAAATNPSADEAVARNAARKRAAATLAVTLLTASQLLLGYPQYVWYSLLAEIGMGVYRGAAIDDRRRALRVAARWTAAKALGALIAAVQLAPTYEALADSTRADADEAFVMSGSLHPANAVQLVAPYALRTRVVGDNTHELGLYCGAVPLALVVWLVGAGGARRRAPAWLLAGVLLALCLALGQYGSIYRWQTWLPIVGSFRYPCRAICLVQLGVAALAACAWQQLVQRRLDPQKAAQLPARGMWLLMALAAAAALTVSVASAPERLAPWPLVIAGPALLAAAVGLVAAAARGVAGALPALIALTAFDAGAYGLTYAVYPGAQRAEPWLAGIERPPGEPTHRVVLNSALGRPGGRTRFVGNQVLLAGWRRADGYSGLVPARQLDEASASEMRAAGVGWLALPESWREIPDPGPRARLAGGSGLRLLGDRPGRIVVATQAAAPARLVVSERFHPGWRAAIDGGAERPACADGAWLACAVPAGRHVVELRFAPRSLTWGRRVSALGIVLSLTWFAAGTLLAVGRNAACWKESPATK